MQLYL